MLGCLADPFSLQTFQLCVKYFATICMVLYIANKGFIVYFLTYAYNRFCKEVSPVHIIGHKVWTQLSPTTHIQQ